LSVRLSACFQYKTSEGIPIKHHVSRGKDERGSIPGRDGEGIFFLFATASRPALGPTQPLIQWVPGAVSRGVKLTTHLHLEPRLKTRGALPPLFHTS